jgi:hypothetical protein
MPGIQTNRVSKVDDLHTRQKFENRTFQQITWLKRKYQQKNLGVCVKTVLGVEKSSRLECDP